MRLGVLLFNFVLILGALYMAPVACRAAEDKTFCLHNGSLEIMLDARTSGIIRIWNKLAHDGVSDEAYAIDDGGFRVEVGSGATTGTLGALTPQSAELKKSSCDGVEARFEYAMGKLRLTVTWRLEPGDDFAVKRARIDYAGPGTFNVSRFDMFDWGMITKPARSIPYYGFLKPSVLKNVSDGEPVPPSDTSTAFFYRYREGGIFSALSCDFALMQQSPAGGRCRSTYYPGFILKAGEPFESEKGIVGVYRRKGVFHAPYQPSDALRSFHYPNVDARLDRGEIDAMSAAVRKFIKPGLYFTVVNGWGVGLPRMIESQQDADTFMHGIDTLRRIPEIEGLHFVHSWCGLTREFREQGLKMTLTPNPFARQVFEYARQKGMALSMFIGTSNNYPLHQEGGPVQLGSPELLSMNAQGARRPGNIAISRQYADFTYNTVCGLRQQFPNLKGLTYDFLSIQPDYDTAHGYLPGRASLYPQYALLRDVNRRLRERFPDLMLRGQVGWMWLGPWLAEGMSMCHNANDHNCNNHRNFLDFHIDQQFANNIRLSNWFTNNCKMHPRDKMNSNSIHNGSNYRAWDYGAWEYCILSQIATSQVFGMLHNLPDEQNGEVFRKEDGEFFRKWIEWHKAHRDYYRLENDLFGEPRLTGVDGYAYGNGKDSIVFLCNPTWRTQTVAVPMDQEIHLPKGAGACTVRELYPEERGRIGLKDGAFDYGSTFVTDVPPQTVMVFEVKPDDASTPLLLGAEGKVEAKNGEYAVSGVTGPEGAERVIAIRPGRGDGALERVTVNGKPLPVARDGKLLLGRIRFGGEPVQPEVADWRATREGERLKVSARFTPPASAREALAGQRLPISKKYDTDAERQRVGWLGWGRFIIHIPAVPTGVDPDKLTGPQSDRVLASFPVRATLNGKPVAVRSNIMGEANGRRRWSGFFIDASDAVAYGKENALELDLPKISEDQFYGLYLPNLTRRKTGEFLALAAPERLPINPAPEAADALIPTPVVERRGERVTLYLKLTLTARANANLNVDEITAEQGKVLERVALGADPRWRTDSAQARPGDLRLGRKPKHVLLRVEGSGAARLRLGSGAGSLQVDLGQLLKAWEQRGDPYEPSLATLAWPERRASVQVELIAPWDGKMRVD